MSAIRLCFVASLGLALVGCATPSTLGVYVLDITPVASSMFEQRLRVDVRVQNASNEPIDATGMELTLDVNGRRFACGVANEAFTVPRLGEARTSIVTSTSSLDVIRQLLRIRSGGGFDYRLRGKVYVDEGTRGPLRFDASGEFDRGALAPLIGAPQSNPE